MTTPLFRALKTAHPESRCTVVVQEQYKPLLVTNPHIDAILTLPRIRPTWLPERIKRLASAALLYWTRIRRRHFDFAISPRWDVDEHLATFLSVLTNAASRVGYSEKASAAKQEINRGFDSAYDLCLPPGPAKHEVLRNLAIAEALGINDLEGRLEVHLTERDRRRAAKLLANVSPSTKLIALGIGAHSRGRRWPRERYARVIGQLSQAHDVRPVILCSGPELGEAAKLAALLPSAPLILSGVKLREVCAVLERCELFLGNDSGAAHLAAAMDCKVIVISRHPRNGDPNHFNSPVRFAPQCGHVQVLQPATGQDDCQRACASQEPHCICKVTIDEVVAAATAMLQAIPTAPRIRSQPWPDQAAHQLLLQSHSAQAIRRALETVRANAAQPMAPV
jgi:ADP-heptose:LPS heptosyltransferase